jgi:hypothetical protein
MKRYVHVSVCMDVCFDGSYQCINMCVCACVCVVCVCVCVFIDGSYQYIYYLLLMYDEHALSRVYVCVCVYIHTCLDS